ncbi:hypothetical protein RB195_018672 [Necator americanus]|uniref:Caspase domain protein n=1 Tax=Necator americanus TaxID=51031 RepID=A0ABR1CCZ3_NECAM
MMRNERRQLLDRSLLHLSGNMAVDEVIIYLQSTGVFTDSVIDKVMSTGSVTAQRTAVIRAVKSRGDNAFDALFRALLYARQPHLAELLKPLINEDLLQTIENEPINRKRNAVTAHSFKSDTIVQPMALTAMNPSGILQGLRVHVVDSNSCPQMDTYLKNRDLIYANFSSPKGLCLIINNENFASMPRRQGTEIDCANLRNLFEQMDYSVVIQNDLTCKEMLSHVRKFANDPFHSQASSAILVVLTHGERDQLLGVGGDEDVLSVYPVLEALNARNAPLLSGKPKLIFIQACRGDRRDTGVVYMDQSDAPRQHPDSLFGLFKCIRTPSVVETTSLRPRESDFVIAYATPPTYVSWRNSLRGSWFIQAICEVFAKHARDMDLLQLLTRVNKRVAECFQTNCSSSLYKQQLVKSTFH